MKKYKEMSQENFLKKAEAFFNLFERDEIIQARFKNYQKNHVGNILERIKEEMIFLAKKIRWGLFIRYRLKSISANTMSLMLYCFVLINKKYGIDIKETKEFCLELLKNKNRDYSGDFDAMDNFTDCEVIKIARAEQGVMIRANDKRKRVSNLLIKECSGEKAGLVKDESIKDTLRDFINYMVILLITLEYKYKK